LSPYRNRRRYARSKVAQEARTIPNPPGERIAECLRKLVANNEWKMSISQQQADHPGFNSEVTPAQALRRGHAAKWARA
jgi:hypothetical protein